MSDAVTVAIITASSGLLLLFVRHWLNTQPKSHPAEKKVAAKVTTITRQSHASVEAVKTRHITDLTHKQISDSIEAVPPFQQEKIRESFIGAQISWRTRLSGIHQVGDFMTVTAEIPQGNGVLFCRARAEDCDGFILAPEGTEFIVTGQIERVSRYEAELIHCTFEIPKKAVA
jgi:hypothetical protein